MADISRNGASMFKVTNNNDAILRTKGGTNVLTTSQQRPMARKLVVIGLALTLFCTAVLEAKKYPLTASSVVPAALGHVDIDKDKNGNTTVSIEVEHLATPQNLTPSADVYIVWVQDRGGSPENQGQLKVDKNLKAEFKSVTSAKNFDLFITGERDKNTKLPAGTEVFRTTIQ
jgi:hypothetical protein